MKLFDGGATILAIVVFGLIAVAAIDNKANNNKGLNSVGKAIDSVMCPLTKAC